MVNYAKDINILLNEIAEKIKTRNTEESLADLIDELEFLNWVKHQEDMYSAYSYCEE